MFRNVVYRFGLPATLLLFSSACVSANDQNSGARVDVFLAVIGLIIFVALILFWQTRQTPGNRARYHLDDHGEHADHEPHETHEEHLEEISEPEEVKSSSIDLGEPMSEPDVTASAFVAADAASGVQAPDDLTVIEGIGPKINELLNTAGIYTYEDLAHTPVDRLQDILQNAGPRFRLADVSTWSLQAQHAAKGDWDGLKLLSEKLKGGRIT